MTKFVFEDSKEKYKELELLEQGGICRLLVFLLSYPDGIQRVRYRTTLGLGSRAAMRDHELLFEAGLIENKTSSNTLLFGLTEKGKNIAQYLKKIQDELRK